jgi:hypothetical protein
MGEGRKERRLGEGRREKGAAAGPGRREKGGRRASPRKILPTVTFPRARSNSKTGPETAQTPFKNEQ